MPEPPASGLAHAYALRTPADAARLYDGWAATYDDGFAATAAYIYPEEVAALYAREGGAGPVLDVGAGTGLVGRALCARGIAPVDGLDLSAEMLAVARVRGGYRALIEADLTRPLPVPDSAYAGAVSAGTFTHGHVGADAVARVARVCAPGALLALGVNAAHFRAEGFAAAFDALAAAGVTSPPAYAEVAIYGPGATHEHREDRALVALARRL
jgi:predicted TPR repeat methyltransferase